MKTQKKKISYITNPIHLLPKDTMDIKQLNYKYDLIYHADVDCSLPGLVVTARLEYVRYEASCSYCLAQFTSFDGITTYNMNYNTLSNKSTAYIARFRS